MTMRWIVCAAVMLTAAWGLQTRAAQPDTAKVARGRYLVQVAECNDCHTPGHFLGREDTTRVLGGSDVGLEVPGLGTFVAPNLTLDKTTGLGSWTSEQIVQAFTGGVRPDGRVLAPIKH